MTIECEKREFNPININIALNIMAMPLLSTMLPYRFGGGSVEALSVQCSKCGEVLGPDAIRGRFEIKFQGLTANLRAFGVCYYCRTISPIEAKFHNDGTALFKGPLGWRRGRWAENRTTSFGAAVVRFVQQKWQLLLPPVLAFGITLAWHLNR
ncbi:MAG TPA: hypothetical protein VGJ93_01790 [Desulfuromonadaceae bacterium]